MSWTQKEDYWHRPLDCHERFFEFYANLCKPLNRECFLVMMNAQIDFPAGFDGASKLREAWKALRFRHPGIATEIHGEERRYYPVRDAGMLEKWCGETFRVEEEAVSADDLFKRFVHVSAAHATCHWIPASNQIALIAAHSRWDAHGVSWVLNDLLSEMETPSPAAVLNGDEAKYLAPSLDEIVGMPDTWDPSWSKRGEELRAQSLDGAPTIGLNPINTTQLPGDTVREEVVFSVEETSALRLAARAQGLTITPALNASAIVETARRNPDNAIATRFTSFGVFDLRKYCPPPHNGPRDAVTVRMMALPFNVEARASWSELTRTLQTLYRQSFKPEDSDLMFVRVPFTDEGIAMAKAAPHDSPQPTAPLLNSLGVLEDYVKHRYGDVEVKEVSFSNMNTFQHSLIQAFTWRGQLHVSASYNEVYYAADFFSDYLSAVKDNVLENLGIERQE